MSMAESRMIRQELQGRKETERILKPRFVLTDKNSSLRTEKNPLPEKASARLIVPGYKDLENLKGSRVSSTSRLLKVAAVLQYLLVKVAWRRC